MRIIKFIGILFLNLIVTPLWIIISIPEIIKHSWEVSE
jgi:hypothetical protein